MVGKNDIRLTKELNMPRTLVPSGVRLNEHYCRRWLPVSLLKELEAEHIKLKPEKTIIRAQIAQFMESGDEVLFISIGRALRLKEKINRCVSLGLRIDKALKSKVKFLNDSKIPVREVNQTCERCHLDENQCTVRTAPHNVYSREKEKKLLNQRLEKLVTDNREKILKI